ncbi:MAG: hypothetical protein K0S33_3840 [Bacteroidetes bacterium]|jgi:putative membrane protein|nr:hypothetical protein [Bacteroidota bacterium]
MNETQDKHPPDAREHLANERTFLAWIRTAIGIMAFGFVVVKFSLFMRQVSFLLGKDIALPPQPGYSSMIGILIVGVGAVMMLLSFLKYKRTEKQLNTASFENSSSPVLLLTLTLLVISVLLIVYLLGNAGIV